MKKLLFVLLLCATLLSVGCVPVADAQEKEPSVIDAEKIFYEETEDPCEDTQESSAAFKESPLEGVTLNTEKYDNGYIPDPEPIKPTVETAGE